MALYGPALAQNGRLAAAAPGKDGGNTGATDRKYLLAPIPGPRPLGYEVKRGVAVRQISEPVFHKESQMSKTRENARSLSAGQPRPYRS